jgi:hypothetical protein
LDSLLRCNRDRNSGGNRGLEIYRLPHATATTAEQNRHSGAGTVALIVNLARSSAIADE